MRQNKLFTLLTLLALFSSLSVCLSGCSEKKPQQELTPWGEPLAGSESTVQAEEDFSLAQLQQNGEIIMLTISGEETYYEYRGRGMGTQFLICEQFASQLGVSLRVELCRDTAELLRRLDAGEGDFIAYSLPKGLKELIYCPNNWAVRADHQELADTLTRWYRPDILAKVQEEEKLAFNASTAITRKVYSPMIDRSRGIISQYDMLFKKYSALCQWDWRLIAAQCYQESCFDSNARSWAGACGLMQIMPTTADHLSLPRNRLFEPEANVAAAARYIKKLDASLRDIQNPEQRRLFVLACYNGGIHHIRDAQALARKYKKNPAVWQDVAQFVLRLRDPRFFNDPAVRYGYMRGNETVDYVARIMGRYANYCGTAAPHLPTSNLLPDMPYEQTETTPAERTPIPKMGPGIPQKATKKYKFHVE